MSLFRKRGGSVDNLLDDLDSPMAVGDAADAAAAAAAAAAAGGVGVPGGFSQEGKKKSASSKNLLSLDAGKAPEPAGTTV